MSQAPNCSKLTVVQGVPNGILGGPFQKTVSLGDGITGAVEQAGKRRIVVSSRTKESCDTLFDRFTCLEKLLMLFDGRFIPVESLSFTTVDDQTKSELEQYSEMLLQRRLAYYSSRDFCQYPWLKLVSFHDALSDDVYSEWRELLDLLDMAYQVFLYSQSDDGMPVDVKSAFMVELAEPFIELVKEKTVFFQTLEPGERSTSLRMCIDAIITRFGTDVFYEELRKDRYQSFLQKAVDSRVRIMHIKKKKANCFDGKDSIRYIMKFSIMYRHILLGLLGIPYGTYEIALKDAVRNIDTW